MVDDPRSYLSQPDLPRETDPPRRFSNRLAAISRVGQSVVRATTSAGRSLAHVAAAAWFPRTCCVTGQVLSPSEQHIATPHRRILDQQLAEPYCPHCGTPVPAGLADSAKGCGRCHVYRVRWRRIYRGATYSATWAEVIRSYKFRGRYDVLPLLAESLAAAVRSQSAKADVIVPVPQHWRRTMHRRFDPVALVADELGRRLEVPAVSLLRRQRHHPPFMGESKARRQEIARDAYAPARPTVRRLLWERQLRPGEPISVLVVDDITTTRSTLAACCRVLRQMRIRSCRLVPSVAVLATAELGERG